jgi:hypothetical protein
MKIEALRKRLDKNRPMTSITIRIPEDVWKTKTSCTVVRFFRLSAVDSGLHRSRDCVPI